MTNSQDFQAHFSLVTLMAVQKLQEKSMIFPVILIGFVADAVNQLLWRSSKTQMGFPHGWPLGLALGEVAVRLWSRFHVAQLLRKVATLTGMSQNGRLTFDSRVCPNLSVVNEPTFNWSISWYIPRTAGIIYDEKPLPIKDAHPRSDSYGFYGEDDDQSSGFWARGSDG